MTVLLQQWLLVLFAVSLFVGIGVVLGVVGLYLSGVSRGGALGARAPP